MFVIFRCGSSPLDHISLNRLSNMRKRYRYEFLVPVLLVKVWGSDMSGVSRTNTMLGHEDARGTGLPMADD